MAKIKRAEEQLKEKTDTFSLSLIFQTACNNTVVFEPYKPPQRKTYEKWRQRDSRS